MFGKFLAIVGVLTAFFGFMVTAGAAGPTGDSDNFVFQFVLGLGMVVVGVGLAYFNRHALDEN